MQELTKRVVGGDQTRERKSERAGASDPPQSMREMKWSVSSWWIRERGSKKGSNATRKLGPVLMDQYSYSAYWAASCCSTLCGGGCCHSQGGQRVNHLLVHMDLQGFCSVCWGKVNMSEDPCLRSHSSWHRLVSLRLRGEAGLRETVNVCLVLINIQECSTVVRIEKCW